MNDLAERLMEELNCEVAFTIGGVIPVPESAVISWVIIAVLSEILRQSPRECSVF